MFHFVFWLCSWHCGPWTLDFIVCIIMAKLYFSIFGILHNSICWHVAFGTLHFETRKATSKYLNNDVCVAHEKIDKTFKMHPEVKARRRKAHVSV